MEKLEHSLVACSLKQRKHAYIGWEASVGTYIKFESSCPSVTSLRVRIVRVYTSVNCWQSSKSFHRHFLIVINGVTEYGYHYVGRDHEIFFSKAVCLGLMKSAR